MHFFSAVSSCGENVGKENRKTLVECTLRGFSYSEDYLFSNRFMEDLGRIYRLKKVIPDPEKYAF